ncbi:DUF4105 domain-containing protein [Saccharospirillum impatiens]|uniref:Lnb N-terminal periplasmic domain-containing protein n=1 Tax=Saccharospirillum impatiens TaxID=169438 RepID=UPI00048C9663|nr:DUF4105 domain-containing protein [Saccharospirillum impatiens]
MTLSITRPLHVVLALLLLGWATTAAASTLFDTSWIHWVEQNRLYHEDGWYKVMHYRPISGGFRSDVEDADFFFAPAGQFDPVAELFSTVRAFMSDTPNLGDEAAQCRYPRRFEWVTDHFPDTIEFPVVECPALTAFIEQAAPSGMTLIYPNAYLNNPASMFGHTFVRVDGQAEGEARNALLALTVSYGADVQPNENGFVYAFKGLTGLYPGSVRSHPYYRQVQNYNELESRDIWEYPLNVSPAQAETFIKAGWDLKDININYAYLLKNCSYRLLGLIEAAFPQYDLVEDFDVYAVPVDTLRALARVGLVQTPGFRPAIASRIHFLASELPRAQVQLAQRLVDNAVASTDTGALNELPAGQQRLVVDLAYEYSRFKAKKHSSQMAEVSYGLLRLRAQQAAGLTEPPPEAWPREPMQGHGVRRAGIGLGYQGDDRLYARFRFRPAYHDNYDRQAGFLDNAQINALQSEFRLSVDENDQVDLALDQLDLVDFRSLTPYHAMTPSLAWSARLGWLRANPNAKSLPFSAEMGLGRAVQTGNGSLGFLLVTIGVATDPQLLAGLHGGWLTDVASEDRFGIEARLVHEFLSEEPTATLAATYNRVLSPNQAVRLQLATESQGGQLNTRGTLDFNWYF